MGSGVYCLRNAVSGLGYIGQSEDLERRQEEHLEDLGRGKHFNSHLQKSHDKYGHEAFVFEVLEQCPVEALNVTEQKWIDALWDTGLLYNVARTVGANMRGVKHTPEARVRMSLAQRGKPKPWQKGKGPNALGSHPSIETRAKMSASHTGVPTGRLGVRFSDEHRAKLSAGKRGKVGNFIGHRHTDETKRLISLHRRGIQAWSKLSADQVQAILVSTFGCRRLAREFNVSKATIQRIRKGILHAKRLP